MKPWYQVVTARPEVREGRSFSPDEFAIALEQVKAGTAPADYTDPAQFFARTCFTGALTSHSGMVLRRLAGQTANTAPALSLVTQFGGGKTHTLTALYHLAQAGPEAARFPGVADLIDAAGLGAAPAARVGVFVGNAWDPAEGRETPWIDLARQLAGDAGVAELGQAAAEAPPGTDALDRVFAAANGPALLLFDETLNFLNRHRSMAEPFYAFLQNLTVAVTGSRYAVAVISLPRSQVEMTDWDQEWQERITKVVNRVAQDLIANDESEISEVVRRRLFADLGSARMRRKVAKTYADWCFERNARLPAEWTAVDSAATDAKAQEFLRGRFEACYPFHPATLSVFQRKWRAVPQFQQTRGALAMLAQWISLASREQFRQARNEPLITLGSAPLHDATFRAALLGQLGEQRLDAAIMADLAGDTAHAQALDADAVGALRNIHRRVGTAILFESSGGQAEKVAHLPELRFALGEPAVETTTIDSAANALQSAGFFIRKVGGDGFRIHHQATLQKVVSDRRAALDEEAEIRPAMRELVRQEFGRGNAMPVVCFPDDNAAVPDTRRLTAVVIDPQTEWDDDKATRERIHRWTRERGNSPRLYPGALVWCVKKPGRELRDSIADLLAWRRVARDVEEGLLGSEFSDANHSEVNDKVHEAGQNAREEVWASYRFLALLDKQADDGLRIIDLGIGHAGNGSTLCGRIVAALKSEALVNDTISASYISRHWPPAFQDNGAWPLTGLRQSFLDGALTRLMDPDTALRAKIAEFVRTGDFGLASGATADGGYEKVWRGEEVPAADIAFERGVFLLTKAKAEELTQGPTVSSQPGHGEPTLVLPPDITLIPTPEPPNPPLIPSDQKAKLSITGTIPRESWNRVGTRLMPKLHGSEEINAKVELSVIVGAEQAESIASDLRQAMDDLGLDLKLDINAA